MSQTLAIPLPSGLDYITRSTDFTAFWDANAVAKISPFSSLDLKHNELDDTAKDEPFEATINLSHANGSSENARCSLVRCFRNEWFSGTFRLKTAPLREDFLGVKGDDWKSAPLEKLHAVQSYDLAESLWDFLLSGNPSKQDHGGLVVFSGGTDSGKSATAQSFALEAIRRNVDTRNESCRRIKDIRPKPNRYEQRLPHLITFEDPLEKWQLGCQRSTGVPIIELSDPRVALGRGFCFTPRQKGIDVQSLAAALNHARRQTPACFFVGEIRNSADWDPVLDFAGSGHLIVVTTHAASLTESIGRVLARSDPEIAAYRREIGARILGIVHLTKREGFVLPTTWGQHAAALSNLVAYGLSSVVPNGENVLGHSQFFEKYLQAKCRPERVDDGLSLSRKLDIEVLQRQ